MLLMLSDLFLDFAPYGVTLLTLNSIPALSLYFIASSRKLSITLICLIFTFIPTLTPILTALNGFQYFTAMNYSIQTPRLIIAGIIIINIFFFSVLLGSKLSLSPCLVNFPPVRLSDGLFLLVIFASTVPLVLFLEAGTILTSDYASLKQRSGAYSSLVNQFFNIALAISFASAASMRRRKWLNVVLISIIVFSLLVSRRNLAVGLFLVLFFLHGSKRVSFRQLFIGIVAVSVLYFIGEARNSGILHFIGGYSDQLPQLAYYSMAGGGANVFLASIGAIELVNSGKLSFYDSYPFLSWFTGVTEGRIYESMGYAYNGGMHIASVLYWNFGVLGVVLVGIFFGAVLRSCDHQLKRISGLYIGGFGVSFSILVCLLLTTILWYSPISILKAGLVILAVSLLLPLLSKRG